MNKQFKQFAIDSNFIEGETITTPEQIKAVEMAVGLEGNLRIEDILNLHAFCGKHLKADWVGRFRDCQVIVGNYTPPLPEYVEEQTKTLARQLPMIDSWMAHNEFQNIHPFQDLNGRVGRLIWLSKAVNEGYNFQRGFLHQYYYQTLNHSNR